jgi:hypothetical protein
MRRREMVPPVQYNMIQTVRMKMLFIECTNALKLKLAENYSSSKLHDEYYVWKTENISPTIWW